MAGWVLVHKSIMDWEWWDDHNTTRLFIALICIANHEDGEWKTYKVKRGQTITSLDKLSNKTGLSVQQTRTSLSKLQSTGEITRKSTKHFTVITVCNYDEYQATRKGGQHTSQQSINTPVNSQSTHQSTTNKEVKETKEDIPAFEIDECLTYLNQKAGSAFKLSTAAHRRFINARLSEGATVQDLKAVVDLKVGQWLNDRERAKYLRPSTLFNSEKFDGYLAETKRVQPTINGHKYDHTRHKEGETYLDRLVRNQIDPRNTDEVALFVDEEKLSRDYVLIIQHHFKTNPQLFPYVKN